MRPFRRLFIYSLASLNQSAVQQNVPEIFDFIVHRFPSDGALFSRRNPDRPVSSDKNLSRGRTTRGRLEVAPTVVPASICSTRAGSARSTALFLSIVPGGLTLAFGDDDDVPSCCLRRRRRRSIARHCCCGLTHQGKKKQPPRNKNVSLSLSLSLVFRSATKESMRSDEECKSRVKNSFGKKLEEKKNKNPRQKSPHSAGCIADPLSCHPPPPKKKRYSMPPPAKKVLSLFQSMMRQRSETIRGRRRSSRGRNPPASRGSRGGFAVEIDGSKRASKSQTRSSRLRRHRVSARDNHRAADRDDRGR